MTKDELNDLFLIGSSLSMSDKFYTHTASGELLEVSAEVILAYLRRGCINVKVNSQGYLVINGETTTYQISAPTLTEDASNIEITPIKNLGASNVQGALEEILGKSGSSDPITQAEYNSLATKEHRLYFVTVSGELRRIYYGSTLIARKATEGETPSNVFPLTFPIVFG